MRFHTDGHESQEAPAARRDDAPHRSGFLRMVGRGDSMSYYRRHKSGASWFKRGVGMLLAVAMFATGGVAFSQAYAAESVSGTESAADAAKTLTTPSASGSAAAVKKDSTSSAAEASAGDTHRVVAAEADKAGGPAKAPADYGTVIPTAFVSSVYATVEADGTDTFDQNNDAPGYDSGPKNFRVRSFDTISYQMHVQASDAGNKGATAATVGFRIRLPYDGTQIQWLTNATNFKDVKVEYDLKDSNDQVYSELSGYYDWTDSKGVIPNGIADIPISVRVLALHNGDLVSPKFTCWMNGGTDDTSVHAGVEQKTGITTASKDSTKEKPVVVSAALKLNVVLTKNSATGCGTYDFHSGKETAPNYSATEDKRYGCLYGMGVGLQLRNTDLTQGLKGVEMPDPNADIKVHVKFNSKYTIDNETENNARDVPSDYEPLIYSIDNNEGYANAGSQEKPWTNNDGRSLESEGGNQPAKGYSDQLPGNNKDGSDKDHPFNMVEHGGTWTSENVRGAEADITISGAKITDWLFPYAGYGYTATSGGFYNPTDDSGKTNNWYSAIYDEKGNLKYGENHGREHVTQDPGKVGQAFFSAGEVWVLQPLQKKDGTSIADDTTINAQRSVNGYLYGEESLLSAYTVSDPEKDGKGNIRSDAHKITTQTYAEDDTNKTNFNVLKATGGGMYPVIRYVSGLGSHTDVNRNPNVNTNCWNTGCDYAVPGQELAIQGGLDWNPNYKACNIAAAMNVLFKYDGDALQTEKQADGKGPMVSWEHVMDPQTGNHDPGNWHAYWGRLVDDNGKEYNWPSDEDMNKAVESYATENNGVRLHLVWDSEWTEGRKYVATLFEERGGFTPNTEKNIKKIAHYFNIGVKVRNDFSLMKHVYPTTVYARVWSFDDAVNQNLVSTDSDGKIVVDNKGKATVNVPSVADKDFNADSLKPSQQGVGEKGKPVGYLKWKYDADGNKAEGNDDYTLGDSLLILPYLSKVGIRPISLANECVKGEDGKCKTTDGDKIVYKEKTNYSLSNNERNADFELTPELVQENAPTDKNGNPIQQGMTTVTVKAVLPEGFTYLPGSSFYGGTYTPALQPGSQGTVRNGKVLDPEVQPEVEYQTRNNLPVYDGGTDDQGKPILLSQYRGVWARWDDNGHLLTGKYSPKTDKNGALVRPCVVDKSANGYNGCKKTGRTILTWQIENVPVKNGKLVYEHAGNSDTPGVIRYSVHVGDEKRGKWDQATLPNAKSLTTEVSIRTTEDTRNPRPDDPDATNVAKTVTTISREGKGTFYKEGINPSIELDQDPGWEIGVYGADTSNGDADLYLLDEMPRKDDQHGPSYITKEEVKDSDGNPVIDPETGKKVLVDKENTSGSDFDGKYYISSWIGEDISETSLTSNADETAEPGSNYEIYYLPNTEANKQYLGKETRLLSSDNKTKNPKYLNPNDIKKADSGWVKVPTEPETDKNGKQTGRFVANFPKSLVNGAPSKNKPTKEDDYLQPLMWAMIGKQPAGSQLKITLTVHQSKPQATSGLDEHGQNVGAGRTDTMFNIAHWNDFMTPGSAFRVSRYVTGRIWIDRNHDGVQNKVCDDSEGRIASGCIAEATNNNSEPSMPNAWATLKVLDENKKSSTYGKYIDAKDIYDKPVEPMQTGVREGDTELGFTVKHNESDQQKPCKLGGYSTRTCYVGGSYVFNYLPEGKYRVYITNGKPQKFDGDSAGTNMNGANTAKTRLVKATDKDAKPSYSRFPGFVLTRKNVKNAPWDDYRDSKGEQGKRLVNASTVTGKSTDGTEASTSDMVDPDLAQSGYNVNGCDFITAITMPSALGVHDGIYPVTMQDAGYGPAGMPKSGVVTRWAMIASGAMGLMLLGCWLLGGGNRSGAGLGRHVRAVEYAGR